MLTDKSAAIVYSARIIIIILFIRQITNHNKAIIHVISVQL